MARRKRRKPYDPSNAHDRRRRICRYNAEVAPIEVDDPFAIEPGEKIVALRSTRDDPLAKLHTHHQIDEAQFRGGRAFQNDWEKAERGPQAVDPDARTRRWRPDARADHGRATAGGRCGSIRIEHELGADGTALVHEVLVLGMTMQQVGERRGLNTQRWKDYFARRFQECLDRLALIYGFAAPPRMPVKSLPR